MEKVIIIKYGELTTKKDNINYFLKTLKNNIENSLNGIEYKLIYDKSRMFIETNNFTEVVERLKKVFGILKVTIAYKIDKDIDSIKKYSLEILNNKEFNTFKVVTKRSDKKYSINSMEVSSLIGGVILKNIKCKVDVHKPDITLNIEIRNDYAYLYFEDIPCSGGYPTGVAGKGLLMLSGGIDSPVAGYLAMKRGIKIECIYFEAPPHTSIQAKEKVLSLAKELSIYNGGSIKVHIVNITDIEEEIYKKCPNEYMITILRRMMYRISAYIAKRSNCKVLINGESVGQVASQTLSSMAVINEVVKIPVIRPVACFDKIEIMALSRKINTYDISILPYEDCCTIFVPKHPVINPNIRSATEYEELFNYKDMIYNAIKSSTVEIVSNKEKDTYKDLL